MLENLQKTKLAKQLALLDSNFDGEVVAAARAACRTLRSVDLTWPQFIDLLGEKQNLEAFQAGYDCGYSKGLKDSGSVDTRLDHHQMLWALKQKENLLNDWSVALINNLLTNSHWKLTAKQRACIERMYQQFCGGK